MRVYLTPPQPSRGLQRIADALTKYAPNGVEIVDKFATADLVVFYVIGRRDRLQALTTAMVETGVQKYAIIQVCLRSTMTPSTHDWRPIWDKAVAVWSYYDLNNAIANDVFNFGIDLKNTTYLDNFYHAPLGVDSEVFKYYEMPREHYVIATSGNSRLQESVRECLIAAEKIKRFVFHVGESSPSWKGVTRFSNGMTDEQLAMHYSACEFVSGLRRKEGFEFPAAEGLLCGARPILFDTPDYRWNYKHWGEYIRETDRQGVVDQLVELFKRGARPVTPEERAEAAAWFNWERICRGFWERCL